MKHTYGANRLCMWYPDDPRDRRWSRADGLLKLVDTALAQLLAFLSNVMMLFVPGARKANYVSHHAAAAQQPKPRRRAYGVASRTATGVRPAIVSTRSTSIAPGREPCAANDPSMSSTTSSINAQ
jgi:hypothetical protein